MISPSSYGFSCVNKIQVYKTTRKYKDKLAQWQSISNLI